MVLWEGLRSSTEDWGEEPRALRTWSVHRGREKSRRDGVFGETNSFGWGRGCRVGMGEGCIRLLGVVCSRRIVVVKAAGAAVDAKDIWNKADWRCWFLPLMSWPQRKAQCCSVPWPASRAHAGWSVRRYLGLSLGGTRGEMQGCRRGGRLPQWHPLFAS